LSYEEVAEVLECSVGTVKSRILRGRRALKDLLDPLLGEHRTASPEHAAHSAHGFSAGTFSPVLVKERMNFAPHVVSLFDDFSGAGSVSKEGKP